MPYCLIADDSPAMRKVVRGLLMELGFEVDEAANGLEALDSCRARAPDAVLLDWNMPVMDGLGFLHALQDAATGTRPKVIFCTTGAEQTPIIRAMSAGASEYLVKPFDKELLASKFVTLGLA
ncbi:response regulator [Dichotomicrobium thermohalophilum]|uniref:Two-component system chemotaxis response regulator CheY n=1 Tax=Dichotomicrobium thermohalophilum TaxID=933063 RepID=A0A397Q8I9_9HYPH|nr:response regulator [Dichotomicrobium thermohalophilum]RIA55847.1 two-component system chemotaxis response regulator CheY [Dichotomicrobium thermohalophilum]